MSPASVSGLAISVAAMACATMPAIAAPEKIEFNRDVRPILSENCFKCHGPDAKERKGERRIDTAEGAIAEHENVRAIVPGNLEASELWLRINSDDPEEQMPPPKSGKHVSSAQKEILRRWIEQGAEYQAHWAYLPP